MHDTHKCRRFLRFRLRTLLLMPVIVGVWLGWQLYLIRERDAVRQSIEVHRGIVVQGDGAIFDDVDFLRQRYLATYPTHPEIPRKSMEIALVRRFLGDYAAIEIVISTSLNRSELARIESAFPEANLVLDVGE